MKTDYTHITMIIDRSGSMEDRWTDVTGGFKAFVEEQKKIDKPCTFSLVAFDDKYDTPVNFQPMENVADTLDFRPRGSTALLDAIGKSITETGEKLAAMDESERPEKVLFVVQTDGYENSSRDWTRASVKALVEKQQKDYSWDFMFLSADLGSFADAGNMGFGAHTSIAYDSCSTTGMIGLVANKAATYRTSNSVEAKNSLNFTESERESIA